MAEAKHQIWLLRHGETEWSKSGQHTGRTDIPLTEAGRHQAEVLGRHLGRRPFALVLTSPLQRARETCRFAGYEDVAQVTADIQVEQPGWSIWSTSIPKGETVEQVGERVRRVIDRAVAAPGDVALFAHAHVLRILAACWLGLPPAGGRLFALGTAAISVLGYEHETRVISVWNQDWRLAPERDP